MVNLFADGFGNHFEHESLEIAPFECLLAACVEREPLLVHHLVVVEQVLAYIEVPLLDALLRTFDAAIEHRMFECPLAEAAFENLAHPAAREDREKVVLEAQEEAARAGIALATASPA